MKRPAQYLNPGQVVDLLSQNRDARLVKTNNPGGPSWLVQPCGARVRPEDIRRIIYRADVVASDDGLLPGILPQTWRAR
jgi:hypothetical protein